MQCVHMCFKILLKLRFGLRSYSPCHFRVCSLGNHQPCLLVSPTQANGTASSYGKSDWIRENKSSEVLWQIQFNWPTSELGQGGQRGGNASWMFSQKMSETQETEKCQTSSAKRNIEQKSRTDGFTLGPLRCLYTQRGGWIAVCLNAVWIHIFLAW